MQVETVAGLLGEFHGIVGDDAKPEFPQELETKCSILDILDNAHHNHIKDLGLDVASIQRIARESASSETELRTRMFPDASGYEFNEHRDDGTLTAILRSSHATPIHYTETVFRSGHFIGVCPFSGDLHLSQGSFLMESHHIAYRFSGRHVFYIIVGRWHGRRAGLFIPLLRCLIFLDAPERTEGIGRWMLRQFSQLVQASLNRPDAFRRRMFTPPGRCSLVLGQMPNMGHFFWQEMSGLDLIVSSGAISSIDSLLIGPKTWGRPKDIFPEIASLPCISCSTVPEMASMSLDLSATLLRPVGWRISSSLQERLYKACENSLSASLISQIENSCKQRRTLWINLRGHNKSWRSQVEGYSALLNSLQALFGDIGVVFDGWTDTAVIRNQIIGKIDPTIQIFDTIGCSFEESIIWANKVKGYISVLGSGLVINSWLSKRPGVGHANRAHLAQRRFWNNVAESVPPVIFIDPNNVLDDGGLYSEYDFDWRILLPPITEILSQS